MENQITQKSLPITQAITTVSSKGLQLVAAFALGATILYAAAFVQTSAVHNAAHDMRHSQGFPCH
ncbi:MAG: CbtB domain-containing protein [Gammaproteobacteria bacterium]